MIESTMFLGNTAGQKGFAVLGSPAVTLNDVSFVDNTFHCARGQYLYEDIITSAVSKTEDDLCAFRDITPPTRTYIPYPLTRREYGLWLHVGVLTFWFIFFRFGVRCGRWLVVFNSRTFPPSRPLNDVGVATYLCRH